MSSQIIFFQKSACDYGVPNVSATASEGDGYAIQALNRSNLSAWITTGSADANNTTWTVDMVDPKYVSEILLVKHNFKNFTVKYWNGSAWTDFSPAINITNNTASTNRYSVNQVSTSKIQITITGTQTADDDKYLYQFIATNLIGQLTSWPMINKPTHNRNKTISKMLSGKSMVSENVGSFSCNLSVRVLRSALDLAIIEDLYGSNEGFLVWLCGGDETQFSSVRQGYRLEDIYLMKCKDDYEPTWYGGMYLSGLVFSMDLIEVVD